MNNNYIKNSDYEKQNNFTMLKKNDTIKSQSSFKNSMGRISALTKSENMVIKNQTPVLKPKDPNQNKTNEQNKLPSNTFIPKEKKEQDRLLRATGAYDLKKADPNEINKHLKLTQKTPDDYYSTSVPNKELTKRLDNEAFGPKTDFSIWNYENNYDKLNKEEQGMLIHKMQLDLNNQGYKDYNGHSLKPDGIFGKKTESAYNQYRKDKQEELEDYNPKDRKIVEGKDYQVLKDKNGKQVLLASTDMTLGGMDIPINKMSYPSYVDFKNEENQPIDYMGNDNLMLNKWNQKGIISGQDIANDINRKRSDFVIKENKNSIINASEEFGVNPGILGAIIYTEQINNVNLLDYYFDDVGGMLGLDTSVGLAQVKISTAKMLEEEGYMPKITVAENERKTENAKRIEALNDPETNIRYAAAYLKYFQDRWKEVYPEIDGRTAILASLYNLGEENTSPNSSPKPNPFGEDAKSHYYYVRELLDLKEG